MRPSLFVGFPLTVLTASFANVQEIHFAPEERLDVIDAALSRPAKNSIDLASYAQTNPPNVVAQLLPSGDIAPP